MKPGSFLCQVLIAPDVRQPMSSPTVSWNSLLRTSRERSNCIVYTKTQRAQKQGVATLQRFRAFIDCSHIDMAHPLGYLWILRCVVMWVLFQQEKDAAFGRKTFFTYEFSVHNKLQHIYRKVFTTTAPVATERPSGTSPTLFLVMPHPKLSCSLWGSVLTSVG